MGSEARNQINNDYDTFFYAIMCHVCKRFGDSVHLKSCRGCKMIFYCDQKHQMQHWKQHKPLCKAIQDVRQKYGMKYRCATTEEWADQKQTFAQLVSSRLGRHLNANEMQMFCFPRECLVCHKRNIKSLESCQKCAASFCKNHKYGIEHKNICASLELCLRTDLFSIREGNNPPDLQPYLQNFLQEYSHISCKNTFRNMKDFIKAFRNIHTDSEMSSNPRPFLNSEYLTHSLTLFYAMRLLNDVQKSKDLVVHVLGARRSEVITLIGWEILPRLIGTMMKVIVIGPELPCELNPSHDCDNCMSREKKCLTFELHNMLYENYVRNSPSFVKPDLVVGFNLGVRTHELPGRSSKETWTPSIELIAKQNCPFILTSATLHTFEKETNIISTILNKEVDPLYSGKNPFASLIPYRTIGMEYVSYMNQYVIIYRSLFITDMRNLSDRYKLMSVFDDEENVARAK